MISHSHARTTSLNVAVVILFIVGFWQFGSGVYITAKAHLAQMLLEHAWQKTLAGNPEAKPWPWADTSPVARLRVPNLGIDQIVLAGASNRNLAFGPAHVLASNSPGSGTSILSGHRDTHFKFLQDLESGDMILLQNPDGKEYSYTVQHMEIADTRTSQLNLKTGSSLVLVTCYPFNVIATTGPMRYVVTASQDSISADRSFNTSVAQQSSASDLSN